MIKAKTHDEFLDLLKSEDPELEYSIKVQERRADLSVQLMDLRKQRGMSQRKLAGKSGVAQSTIAHIERGDVDATSKTLDLLMIALNSKYRTQLSLN
ncbi:transcriptional regulator [Paucilactobacillus hokkaidonensis JCM 18461]|uniref:Transcriptional regulator n=2 Tax=Paucilactobacillus hokkaidonensis TaxID=1193095 RepID=A0A0A1GSG0_9LACO|nr:helix-turn-helix transcriptional regulator [Paucilactobacillus hokkaidonensis]KRO09569.1 hypothetical protein IV59_GL000530 [Paucilactobacillus hokkaidonensis]BAP85207.1 transcriptional regulator [Paucilactobacillus hokkaidonensis JCM 18461]